MAPNVDSENPTLGTARRPPDWAGTLTRATGHLFGTAILAVAGVWLTTHTGARRAVFSGLADGVFVADTLVRAGLHVALSAAVWGVVWAIARRAVDALNRRAAASNRRGAVTVETLLVMPVALLLIMGLAQLAIVNIAATVTNFAAYEAARTAWVWEGERGAGRMADGASDKTVEEYARIQAATVLTPVAPGAFDQNWNLPERARQARGMMVGAQMPIPYDDLGATGMDIARVLRSEAIQSSVAERDRTLALALDPSLHPRRTVKKFTWSIQASDVSVTYQQDPPEIEVELTYHHYCAVPLVGAIFGEYDVVNGRRGYYRTFERTITRRRQLPARGAWPKWDQGRPDRSINYF